MHYTPDNPKGTLHSFVFGLNEQGEIIRKEFGEHDGNDEILYIMRSERDSQTIYEFGIAVIKGRIIYVWAIDETEDMVKSDKVYGENVKYFKVLK